MCASTVLLCTECNWPMAVSLPEDADDPMAVAVAAWKSEAEEKLLDAWDADERLSWAVELADAWLGEQMWRIEMPAGALDATAALGEVKALIRLSGKDLDWLDGEGLLDCCPETDDAWSEVGVVCPSWFRADRIRLFVRFPCECQRANRLPLYDDAQFRPLAGEERRRWAEHRRRFPRRKG